MKKRIPAENRPTKDFWASSGFHLLARDKEGRLTLTDGFFGAFWRLPELALVPSSPPAERALREKLEAEPMRPITSSDLIGIEPDMVENYRAVERFRTFLQQHSTLEKAYMAFTAGERHVIDFPPIFIDHLAHVLLRAALDTCSDPFCVRAGELFFRPQRVSIIEEKILLADAAMIDSLGAHKKARQVEMDLLDAGNDGAYWARTDAFDMALNIAYPLAGLDGLARAMEAWLRHFLGLCVHIKPVSRIDDDHWVWHIGLDQEANLILNALYRGEQPDDKDLLRILALFRMEVENSARIIESVANRPIWLALAMDGGNLLRMKPQNLLVNMPLKACN